MLDRIPQVFISYSWTTPEYKQSVINLASRLRHDGVDVKLDVWDLREGQDKYAYMEQCVTNPEIDRVLILSDRAYAEKADQRKGGVGDETTIISAEIYGNAEQQKFIPVVMERDENGKEYLPAYLKSRIFRDLSGSDYESEYEELLRTIFEAPLHRKPELGRRPSWLAEETPDALFPVKDAVRKLSVADLAGAKTMAVQDFLDLYIEAMKQFYVEQPEKDTYLKNFAVMKEYRDVFLDYLKVLSSQPHFGATVADQFERLYNALYNIKTFVPDATSCSERRFDLFRVHIWELFICTVTFMLHFELYEDINALLVHTYYLRASALGEEVRPRSYDRFRFYSPMLEEIIKPTLDGDLSRKYTLAGHLIYTEREYAPIYTRKNIANADLFLYQVYNGLDLGALSQRHPWFPSLYVYADEYNSMWVKLTSKRYCEKIMLIFGADTIAELKNCIGKCRFDENYHYSGAWDPAPAILNWIKLEDIATLP